MPIADGPERARRLLQTANLKGPRGARTRARPASALRTQNAMHQRRRGPARCGPSRPRNRQEHWIPRRGVCASHVPAALQAVAGDPRRRRHRARLLLARTVGGGAQACCKFLAQTQGFPRSRVSCARTRVRSRAPPPPQRRGLSPSLLHWTGVRWTRCPRAAVAVFCARGRNLVGVSPCVRWSAKARGGQREMRNAGCA